MWNLYIGTKKILIGDNPQTYDEGYDSTIFWNTLKVNYKPAHIVTSFWKLWNYVNPLIWKERPNAVWISY